MEKISVTFEKGEKDGMVETITARKEGGFTPDEIMKLSDAITDVVDASVRQRTNGEDEDEATVGSPKTDEEREVEAQAERDSERELRKQANGGNEGGNGGGGRIVDQENPPSMGSGHRGQVTDPDNDKRLKKNEDEELHEKRVEAGRKGGESRGGRKGGDGEDIPEDEPFMQRLKKDANKGGGEARQ